MSKPSTSFLRGCFVVFDPGAPADFGARANKSRRLLPFRFNPEQLSRSLQLQQARAQPGLVVASDKSQQTQQAADATLGPLRETFSVLLRFDFDDRHASMKQLPAELGIGPEIAALESLVYPVESPREHKSDGKEPVAARPELPTVLFVWGRKRVLPVNILAMTINETRYDSNLSPLRAEIEVSLQVLNEDAARGNKLVAAALGFSASQRASMASLFFDNTASQSTNILPL